MLFFLMVQIHLILVFCCMYSASAPLLYFYFFFVMTLLSIDGEKNVKLISLLRFWISS